VQIAVDTEHHLIVHHEVTNVGTDRAQLASTATAAKEALGFDNLEAVADRCYFRRANAPRIGYCRRPSIPGLPAVRKLEALGYSSRDSEWMPTTTIRNRATPTDRRIRRHA
jgi:hypothetical protein